MNKEVIIVNKVFKKFKISKKQQKIDRTKDLYKEVLKGVSFSVNKGEIFGLLGPNGAGKTTTLRCLSTLLSQDSGEILINGVNTNNDIVVKKGKKVFLKVVIE